MLDNISINEHSSIRIDERGRIVTEGSQVLLGGNDRYVAMCHKCWQHAIASQARN